MTTFASLSDVHRRLERLFFEHQRQLLHFEWDAALAALYEYEAYLRKHIADEETHLLPLYLERGEIDKGGAAQLFLDEHVKLLNHVELFKAEIAGLKAMEDPDERVIWLLGREAFFKKLNDHHDIREARYLYPELDRVASAEEKREIFARLALPPAEQSAATN